MDIDVAKLVGAASAPVALIIATSIFLGNLGAKYALLGGMFRSLSEEFRRNEDKNSVRSRSLRKQISSYIRRLRLLMVATFWLSCSLLCFIATVMCTSLSVLMPKFILWTIFTALFSFAGMFILAASVVIEIVENHQAKEALILETAEIDDVLPESFHDQDADLQAEIRR